MNTQAQMIEVDEKAVALAKHLNIELDEVEEGYSENNYDADGCEYLVLTDEEADEAAIEYIKESLWAFNANFLAEFTGLPEEVFTALQPQCESANEAILAIIGQGDGLDHFAYEAIAADGRGHFMSSYDGEEIEAGDYFIYRIN